MPVNQNTYTDYLKQLKINKQLSTHDTKIKEKIYNPYHTIKNTLDQTEQPLPDVQVERYLRVRYNAIGNESQVSSLSFLIPSWDDRLPVASPYERGYLTDLMIRSSAAMVPDVNASKLTSGPSLRNARLCEQAYADPANRLTTVDDVTYVPDLSNTNNYAIYKNVSTSTVVIAFRGTDVYRDIITDYWLLAGYTTNERFVNSRNIYETIKNHPDYVGWTIEATGHSLGGTLALYLNNLYGIRADVFDPAIGNGLFLNNPNKSNATAHIVKGDIVSPLVYKNNVVGQLFIYPVEDITYGYYGYHLITNFYTPP